MKRFFYLCLTLFLFGASHFSASAKLPASVNGEKLPSLAPILETVMPGVVHIKVEFLPFNVPGKQQIQPQGFGSGVIIDQEHGYIITNAHVVERAKEVTVTLNDGRIHTATIVGSDNASDIAVLQINAENLTVVPMGDSDSLRVGDFVAAIGSPFGAKLKQSVTSGIVSALERSGLGVDGYESFIQTDASINFGNSGGALIDLNGELIGINTAIYTPTGAGGGNIGISFAIPINMAKSVAQQLIQYGKVHRGVMGIIVQTLTPQLAEAFDVPNENGALITQIHPNSPAEHGGLQVGDIIQKINKKAITTDAAEVRNIAGLLRVGTAVTLDILRDGKKMPFEIIIADPQQFQQENIARSPFLFGISFVPVDQYLSQHGGHVKGIGVQQIQTTSPAAQGVTGLLPGDIIISANKQSVKTMAELEKAITLDKDSLLLHILRGNNALFIVLSPAAKTS